ncbi:MAG: disulfide bond formation protein DsbD [Odoribacter sp.]|nr:disulfide bond formation protein DsbD [Odoribacter sp.]
MKILVLQKNKLIIMIRKITIIALLLVTSFKIGAQIYDPVSWDFSYEKKSAKQFELIFTATVEEKSHIYSMDVPKSGPIPTTFRFDTISGYTLDGDPFEVTKPEEIFDEAFGFKIKTFSKKAEFRQKITANAQTFPVTGAVNFMACNNATCLPPRDVEFSIRITDGPPEATLTASGSNTTANRASGGMLKFFIISLLAGFAGVLTPCVFPMIPMTVAFFSQGAENRSKAIFKAIIFGLSIVLIYSSLGIIVSLTSAGAGFTSALATHWIPNSIFFILFMVFAASFFGAFEIVLPNSWVTSADSKVDKGGILAAFFMGLTTVIVSFSCTGPIIGVLLVQAATGDILRPTIGMLGFGIAFALPFTIFALFPSVMSRLPKSGGWLNSVKVVLGFIMIAFSMKFLSTIDSVYSLKIISRDIYLAVWIVVFSLMGLYLMGKIKFSHDSDLPHIGTFRLFLIIAVFTFVVYLIPGLFGAPLKGLSALLPDQGTSKFNITRMISDNKTISGQSITPNISSDLCSTPKFGEIFDMPLGLKGYFDYKQGLACAKERGKPVLIDFKGHACANCKLMEARVWSDPEVLKRLNENFVIISLYVDDRTQLPENEWVTSSIDGKLKKTIGKVNEDLEISKYKTNSLPLYIITDHEGNPVNTPSPTNLNVEEYKKWLDEGVAAFKKIKNSQNFPNFKVTV